MTAPPAANHGKRNEGFVRAVLAGAALLALFATLTASVYAVREYERSAESVEHTMLVRSGISDLSAALDQAESSARGYLLTGRAEYLDPYDAALQSTPQYVDHLRTLTADNAAQQQRIGAIRPLVAIRLEELQKAIDARDRTGKGEAVAIVQTNVGLHTMESIADRLRAMVGAEDALLATCRTGQRERATLLLASLVASSITLGLFLTIAAAWARLAETRRRSAESNAARLRAENEALAERHRTAEFQERFVAILGHDLRNPLSSMTMGLAVLRMSGPDKYAETLTRLERSARRMTRMIEQLIDLARSRLGGGIPVKRTPTNLGQLVAEVSDEARTSYPGRPVAIEADGDLQGEWDPDRLAQVISNLIENALRHGSDDAPVSIRVHGDRGRVALAVHNAGPAVPSDLARVIFDPFRRGERESNTPLTSGLGLGLYIARQIVSAHGGTIGLKSTDREGTTFTVELPRAPVPSPGETTSP